jgi:hypothetical protein
MTGIHFFDIPIEIRLQIYSEILVQSAPIAIKNHKHGSSRRPSTICVYPELLRVNKKAHSEASSLLYSKNRFQFPDFSSQGASGDFALFLRQIGSQTKFIRHICIDLPRFYFNTSGRTALVTLDPKGQKDLELIRDTCTSLTTLELFSYGSPLTCQNSYNVVVSTKGLDLVNMRTKAIPSIKKIVAIIRVWRKELLNDELMNRMRDYGWTVEVTELKYMSDDALEYYFDYK